MSLGVFPDGCSLLAALFIGKPHQARASHIQPTINHAFEHLLRHRFAVEVLIYAAFRMLHITNPPARYFSVAVLAFFHTTGDRSEQALVSAFNAVRKITTPGGMVTYDTDRARGVSHGDLAWANMLAVINEPLGRENGSGGGSVREF